MTEKSEVRFKAWYLPALLLLAAAMLAIGMSAAGALAGNPSAPISAPISAPKPIISEVDSAPAVGPPPVSEVNPNPLTGDNPKSEAACPGSYHYLLPQAGGPCNGCSVRVGDRFTLDMMAHSNRNHSSSHQAYLMFTYTSLQNVRVSSPDCALDSALTGDATYFDGQLQNEVCNGPEPCVFRGNTVPPGSIAYASGALLNPPPASGDFRVAYMSLCAVAPGEAVLRWEFNSPDHYTEVGPGNITINPVSCYRDYIINVTE